MLFVNSQNVGLIDRISVTMPKKIPYIQQLEIEHHHSGNSVASLMTNKTSKPLIRSIGQQRGPRQSC